MRARSWRWGLPASVGLLLVLAGPVDAQVEGLPPMGGGPDEDQIVRGPVSPGGAFARSLVFPGWGHFASDSPTRGSFYVTAQSATLWMVFKSVMKRRSAERFREAERAAVQSELRLQGVQNPDSLRFLSDNDARVQSWDDLRETRSQQVEDWVSLGVFLTLLGAADAFVAAHLADFPEPLSIEVLPGSAPRGVEFRLRYPLARLPGPW